MARIADEPKPLIWRGASKADFMAFPRAAQREMGYALFLAQMGERHPIMAKTLKGFGGGTVIEVRESFEGNAYRAVYTDSLRRRRLRSSRVPEEVEEGQRDPEGGNRSD